MVCYYVDQAGERFDLRAVRAIGLDEAACKRGHHSVTVFIDMARRKRPMLFVTPGRSKDTLRQFAAFLSEHGGEPGQILEVVCDISPTFLQGVFERLPNATINVDWFHIVQVFTRSVDDVRKLEGKEKPLPNHLRWALLKRGELDHLTTNQLLASASAEITVQGLNTATAWRLKEKLAWVHKARTPRSSRWRITHFLNWARALLGHTPGLEPMRKALATLKNHIDRVVQRWTSTFTNDRLEGCNGLFLASRATGRGYRNTATFITMIYLIGSPAGSILEST